MWMKKRLWSTSWFATYDSSGYNQRLSSASGINLEVTTDKQRISQHVAAKSIMSTIWIVHMAYSGSKLGYTLIINVLIFSVLKRSFNYVVVWYRVVVLTFSTWNFRTHITTKSIVENVQYLLGTLIKTMHVMMGGTFCYCIVLARNWNM